MAEQVKARRRPLEAWSWVAQGGWMRRDSVVARLRMAGVGWERELTNGGAHHQRGEREKTSRMEDVNQRRKCILWNTPKARTSQAGRQRERRPAEEVGQLSEAEPAGSDPKREFKGKIFF
jgi:hypothetical protein